MHLMAYLKDYMKATHNIPGNKALQEITFRKLLWTGRIKDYEGVTFMQCSMVHQIRYLEVGCALPLKVTV